CWGSLSSLILVRVRPGAIWSVDVVSLRCAAEAGDAEVIAATNAAALRTAVSRRIPLMTYNIGRNEGLLDSDRSRPSGRSSARTQVGSGRSRGSPGVGVGGRGATGAGRARAVPDRLPGRSREVEARAGAGLNGGGPQRRRGEDAHGAEAGRLDVAVHVREAGIDRRQRVRARILIRPAVGEPLIRERAGVPK